MFDVSAHSPLLGLVVVVEEKCGQYLFVNVNCHFSLQLVLYFLLLGLNCSEFSQQLGNRYFLLLWGLLCGFTCLGLDRFFLGFYLYFDLIIAVFLHLLYLLLIFDDFFFLFGQLSQQTGVFFHQTLILLFKQTFFIIQLLSESILSTLFLLMLILKFFDYFFLFEFQLLDYLVQSFILALLFLQSSLQPPSFCFQSLYLLQKFTLPQLQPRYFFLLLFDYSHLFANTGRFSFEFLLQIALIRGQFAYFIVESIDFHGLLEVFRLIVVLMTANGDYFSLQIAIQIPQEFKFLLQRCLRHLDLPAHHFCEIILKNADKIVDLFLHLLREQFVDALLDFLQRHQHFLAFQVQIDAGDEFANGVADFASLVIQVGAAVYQIVVFLFRLDQSSLQILRLHQFGRQLFEFAGLDSLAESFTQGLSQTAHDFLYYSVEIEGLGGYRFGGLAGLHGGNDGN